MERINKAIEILENRFKNAEVVANTTFDEEIGKLVYDNTYDVVTYVDGFEYNRLTLKHDWVNDVFVTEDGDVLDDYIADPEKKLAVLKRRALEFAKADPKEFAVYIEYDSMKVFKQGRPVFTVSSSQHGKAYARIFEDISNARIHTLNNELDKMDQCDDNAVYLEGEVNDVVDAIRVFYAVEEAKKDEFVPPHKRKQWVQFAIWSAGGLK